MLRINFESESTRALHRSLINAYPTDDDVERLLEHAGIAFARYPRRKTVSASWESFLIDLQRASEVERLLKAVLGDSDSSSEHGVVKGFLDGQPSSEPGYLNGNASLATKLLVQVLRRYLGEDAARIAPETIARLAREHNVSDADLFDATRFAIEYHLLTAKEITPTLLLSLASGQDDEALKDFRGRLREGLKAKALRRIKVPVEGHRFFSRAIERQEDWRLYFELVHELSESEPMAGATLCRIVANGFVAAQSLIAGLLARLEDDWCPIIREYEHQVGDDTSAFVSFQATQWNTWLMWGPSIPICQCKEWEGIRAFQYGYGDENNSMPVIGGANNAPTPLERIPGAFEPKDRSTGAVRRELTGRLRWGPWLFRQPTTAESLATTGEHFVLRPDTSLTAKAQRVIYDDALPGGPRDSLLFQVEKLSSGIVDNQSYFSAYLWLMFLVARKPDRPGQAPRRLTDSYPRLNARPADRAAKHLWCQLLPIYVHANIADGKALGMHRRTLINNAIGLLRQIWTDQPTLFPDVTRGELCFCLVCGSDFSGCGYPIPFPSEQPLLEILRGRLAEEPDREFASSILLPPSDETQATRPAELALFYSTCHLPDLVADYYEYVQSLKRT